MATPDMDIIKEIPGYKVILKAVLKSQIQQLVEQLASHTDEESVILTASVSDGTLSHLGSDSGKFFLDDHEDIKSQFLGFCLKRFHKKKAMEKMQQQKPPPPPPMVAQPWPANYGPTGPRPRLAAPNSRLAVVRGALNLRHEPYPAARPQRRSLDSSFDSPKTLHDSQLSSPIVKQEPHESPHSSASNDGHSFSQTSNDGNIPNDKQGNDNQSNDSGQGDSNKSDGDPNINIKVEAISEADMELEITGVELGKSPQPIGGSQNMGYDPQAAMGSDQQSQLPYKKAAADQSAVEKSTTKAATTESQDACQQKTTAEKSTSEDKLTEPEIDKNKDKNDSEASSVSNEAGLSSKENTLETYQATLDKTQDKVPDTSVLHKELSQDEQDSGEINNEKDVSHTVEQVSQMPEHLLEESVLQAEPGEINENMPKESVVESKTMPLSSDQDERANDVAEAIVNTSVDNTENVEIGVNNSKAVLNRSETGPVSQDDSNSERHLRTESSLEDDAANCESQITDKSNVNQNTTDKDINPDNVRKSESESFDMEDDMDVDEEMDSFEFDEGGEIGSFNEGEEYQQYTNEPSDSDKGIDAFTSESPMETFMSLNVAAESNESVGSRNTIPETSKTATEINKTCLDHSNTPISRIFASESKKVTDSPSAGAGRLNISTETASVTGPSVAPTTLNVSADSNKTSSSNSVSSESNREHISSTVGLPAGDKSCASDTDLMGLYYSEPGESSSALTSESVKLSSSIVESPQNPNIMKMFIRKFCREIVYEIVENVCEKASAKSNEKASAKSNTEPNIGDEKRPDDSHDQEKQKTTESHSIQNTEDMTQSTNLTTNMDVHCDKEVGRITLPHENPDIGLMETNETRSKDNLEEVDSSTLDKNLEKGSIPESGAGDSNALIVDSETFKNKDLRQIVMPTSTDPNNQASEVSTKDDSNDKDDNATNEDNMSNAEVASSCGDSIPDTSDLNIPDQSNRPAPILDLWSKITGDTNTTNEELIGLITQKLIEECSKAVASTDASSSVPSQRESIDRSSIDSDKSSLSKDGDKSLSDVRNPESEAVKDGQSATKVTKPSENPNQSETEKSQSAQENSKQSPAKVVAGKDIKEGEKVSSGDIDQTKTSQSDKSTTANVQKGGKQPTKVAEQPVVIDLESQGNDKPPNQNIKRGEVTPVKHMQPGVSLVNRTPPQKSGQSPQTPHRGRGRPRKHFPSPGATPKKKNFIENLIATGIPIIIPDDDDTTPPTPPERPQQYKTPSKGYVAMSNKRTEFMSPPRSRTYQQSTMNSPPSPAVKPRPIAPKPTSTFQQTNFSLSSPKSTGSHFQLQPSQPVPTLHYQSHTTPPRRQEPSYDMQQQQTGRPLVNVFPSPSQNSRQFVDPRVAQNPQQVFIQSPQQPIRQQQFISQNPQISQQQQVPRQSPQGQGQIRRVGVVQSPGNKQTPPPAAKRNISGTLVVIDDDTPTPTPPPRSPAQLANKSRPRVPILGNQAPQAPVAGNKPRASSEVIELDGSVTARTQVGGKASATSDRRMSSSSSSEPALPVITNVHSIAPEKERKTTDSTDRSSASQSKGKGPEKSIEKVNIKKEPVDTQQVAEKSNKVSASVNQDKEIQKRPIKTEANKTDDDGGPPLKRVKREPNPNESHHSDTSSSKSAKVALEEMNKDEEENPTIHKSKTGDKSMERISIDKSKEKSNQPGNNQPVIKGEPQSFEKSEGKISSETITSPSKQRPELELDIDMDGAEGYKSLLSLQQVLDRMPSFGDEPGTSRGDNQSADDKSAKRSISNDSVDRSGETSESESVKSREGLNIKQEVDEASESSAMSVGSMSEKQFGCGDCGKTFNSKKALSLHFKIHTREQPFECDVCGKHYSLKASLKKHIYTHFKGQT